MIEIKQTTNHENTMLIFFDTEFTTLTNNPKLISIGFVSENGREFYAELSDTYQSNDARDFVRENVLPLLHVGRNLMTMSELKVRLSHWLSEFNCHVTLATDSIQWDWPWIQLILNDETWPKNIAPNPLLLTINYIRATRHLAMQLNMHIPRDYVDIMH